MYKVLIFGNSGSGKSTLAKEISSSHKLAHLDLDTLAWKRTSPPERMPLDESATIIKGFLKSNNGWVIEGCYTDLLEMAVSESTQIIFMNLPIEICIANAKKRPWEPHKYKSKEAQDANLDMLIHWIAQYNERDDTFSLLSHEKFFKKYPGSKKMYISNERNK